MGARRLRADERSLEVSTQRLRSAVTVGWTGCQRVEHFAAASRHPDVTTVGTKLVTPCAGSLAPTSQIEAGSSVKSCPNPPFSWISIRPGASTPSPTSTVVASAGRAIAASGPIIVMRPSWQTTASPSVTKTSVAVIAVRPWPRGCRPCDLDRADGPEMALRRTGLRQRVHRRRQDPVRADVGARGRIRADVPRRSQRNGDGRPAERQNCRRQLRPAPARGSPRSCRARSRS